MSTFATVRSASNHAEQLDDGRSILPGDFMEDVDVDRPIVSQLIEDGKLIQLDSEESPDEPVYVDTLADKPVTKLRPEDDGYSPSYDQATESIVWAPGTSGPGGGSSNVPDPTDAGQMPISTEAGADGWSLQDAATPSEAVPNPDTEEGSVGTSNTFVVGGGSAPRSPIYDAFGHDVVHLVADAGATLELPATTTNQSTVALLTEDCLIIMPPDPSRGDRCKVVLEQDGTGGWDRSWPTNVTWAGSEPVWSASPGEIDMVEFYCFDGQNWIGRPFALGFTRPPSGLQVVQSVYVPSFFEATFPAEITPGNAVLMVREMTNPVPADAPSGGGCSNWTKIAGPFAFRPGVDADNIDIWIGTASVGGPGSEAVSAVEQSIVAKFWEIAGVAADPANAFTVPVLRTIADMGATTTAESPWSDEWTPDPIVSEQSGSMPVWFLTGALGIAEIGDGSANYEMQQIAAPWITDPRIPDYQGNDGTWSTRMVYQLNSTEGEAYAPTMRRRNDNGNAYSVNALGFFLQA